MSVIEMVEDVSNDRIYTLATLGFLAGGTYLTWFKGKDGLNAPFTIGCVMLGIALVADWNFNRKANSRSSAWEAEYRDEELLYKDDFETMTPIPEEKGVFVATRINEPHVTYFIREESVAGDRLYRILTIEEAGTNSPLHPTRIEATMDSGSGDAIIKYIRHRNQQLLINEYEWQNPHHKGIDSLWCPHCGTHEIPSEESQKRDSGTTEDTCTACGNELIDLESMSYQEYAAESREWDKIEWYMDTMTTEGKHTASAILEAILDSDDQTKAEALDWLIDNYYIHADEQWNAAYILALADALDIQHDFEKTMGAESFAVEAYDEKMTVWICGGCNSRFEDQNDAEACCEGIPEDELYHHDPKSRDARKVHLQGGKQGDWRAEYSGAAKAYLRGQYGRAGDWPTFSELVFKYPSEDIVELADEKEACFYADGFPFCFSVGGRHSGGTISDGLHLGHDPDVWSEPVWGPVGCGSVAADDTDDEALEYLMSGHHPRVSASRADILRWRNWARKTYQEYEDSLRMNAEAMSPSAVVAKKGRVRTASGKPHTPRKLKKDQNITPEEARKRVRFEASQNPPAEAFNPAELIGEPLVRPDGPMTVDQAQGFMTNLRRYRKQMAAEDTDDTEEEDWQDIIMEISVADELFDDLTYYFPDEWYDIFLSAYDDPEAEGYQILIIHEDDFDTFIEMRDSLRYLPPSPAREIKEGINLEAFWDEELEI